MGVNKECGKFWQDYAEELWGTKFIVEPCIGFISYEVKGDGIFICDLYIVPEKRNLGHGKELEKKILEIGRELNKDHLICQVQKRDKYYLQNLKIYTEHCGYRKYHEDDSRIMLIKTILKGGFNE